MDNLKVQLLILDHLRAIFKIYKMQQFCKKKVTEKRYFQNRIEHN